LDFRKLSAPASTVQNAEDPSPVPKVQQLTIDLGPRSYPILIGEGLLAQSELLARHIPPRRLLVVTNATVAGLHFEQLRRGLKDFDVSVETLPEGERFKTLATASRLFDALIEARIGRDGAAVAFGGGVIGDLTGFAAACYQRGIAFVQVPTTLLAQVDSSVGGKTGVNHPAGKNLIGAFHQPLCVISDTATLRTLPDRELRSGLAEVIKCGLICDAEFLGWIETHLEELLGREPRALEHVIRRSCEIKAAIVSRDEREQGPRALLNLGHTFGHAIESATGYGEWLHGEAVAAGLLIAVSLSTRVGWLSKADLERVRALLKRAGFPLAMPAIGSAQALAHMQHDKKVRGGSIRLILLRNLGSAEVTDRYDPGALTAVLRESFGP
jgi:3-dehydroquinate synthase